MVSKVLAPLKRRVSSRAAAALLLLLALPALLGAVLYKPVGAGRSVNYAELPELFARAAAHLNASAASVERALAGRAPLADREGARLVLAELEKFRDELEREDETGIVASLKRATGAYARSANASLAAYEAAEVLYGSRGSVRRFLDAVLDCDAAAMSEAAALVEGNLTRAARLIGEAIAELAAVKPGDLPSEEHRELVESAAEKLARAHRALRELLKAVDIARRYPGDLKALCAVRRSGGFAQPSPGAVSALLGLSPGDAGPYAYPISRLKALIGGANPGGSSAGADNGAGGAGGVGGGAGYQPPPSDD